MFVGLATHGRFVIEVSPKALFKLVSFAATAVCQVLYKAGVVAGAVSFHISGTPSSFARR